MTILMYILQVLIMQFNAKYEHKLHKVGWLAALEKLYGRPASFCKKNTFLYDPADSWLGDPPHHHKGYCSLIYHHKQCTL